MSSEPQLPIPVNAAKALALGCHGEDMAAYRYLIIAEKAVREEDRNEFQEMVREEQQHREMLQALLNKHFPGEQFMLTTKEKSLVESGGPKSHPSKSMSFEDGLRVAIASEGKTAQFYDQMHPGVQISEIQELFKELAAEGFEHQQRLIQIAKENGINVPPSP